MEHESPSPDPAAERYVAGLRPAAASVPPGSSGADRTVTYLLILVTGVVAVLYSVVGGWVVALSFGYYTDTATGVVVLIALIVIWTLIVFCGRRAIGRLRQGDTGFTVMLIPAGSELAVFLGLAM